MILRTLIIDDEPLAHDVILTFAKEVPFIAVVGQCYSATEALTVLNNQPVDLLFLDIQMPLLTGIELLKMLPNKPLVIITSAYEEFALQGYELDVTDYLLKPFRFDRFLQAVNKALTRHNSQNEQPAQAQNTTHKTADDTQQQPKKSLTHILIKVDRKQVRVALSEVCCLEAYGNYVKVWRAGICLLTPSSLTRFADMLPQSDFIRVHKSVIVNKSYIDYIEDNTLYLKGGQCFAIAQQHKKKLKNDLN
ncbi:MAG: response regulator transcription factor [Algicola sp.]|nr:response regulator transcription factor [Algicola sp.]